MNASTFVKMKKYTFICRGFAHDYKAEVIAKSVEDALRLLNKERPMYISKWCYDTEEPCDYKLKKAKVVSFITSEDSSVI